MYVNGTLYGTTWAGGEGLGTIFAVSSNGDGRIVYHFSGHNDGENPIALIAVNGAIYGVSYNYGKYDGGVFFKLDSSDYLTPLHEFGHSGDGVSPNSLVDVKGKLYGTTTSGGADSCSYGCGVVFRTTTAGDEKVLYRFAGGSDGENPFGTLVDVKGMLYGTTRGGGSTGNGTVFSVTLSGTEHVLYSFAGGSDGAAPEAGLLYVKGMLYGTTAAGGGSGCGGKGCGTVFSIGATQSEKVLYSFKGGADGASPQAPLVDVFGTLYGTTYAGGGSECGGAGCGSVYSISTTGRAERVIHSYGGGNRGRNPAGGLLLAGSAVYGTTTYGGARRGLGPGTVFSIL